MTTGVIAIAGKFSAGVTDPASGFTAGVTVTGSSSCVANIFENVRKNLKWRSGIIRCPGKVDS